MYASRAGKRIALEEPGKQASVFTDNAVPIQDGAMALSSGGIGPAPARHLALFCADWQSPRSTLRSLRQRRGQWSIACGHPGHPAVPLLLVLTDRRHQGSDLRSSVTAACSPCRHGHLLAPFPVAHQRGQKCQESNRMLFQVRRLTAQVPTVA